MRQAHKRGRQKVAVGQSKRVERKTGEQLAAPGNQLNGASQVDRLPLPPRATRQSLVKTTAGSIVSRADPQPLAAPAPTISTSFCGSSSVALIVNKRLPPCSPWSSLLPFALPGRPRYGCSRELVWREPKDMPRKSKSALSDGFG
uniref:Uncharacterized protein n=1 Tax=Plectus sambesii TaxID=2011161 RepID=A0A914XQT7_9BILA